MDAVASGAIDFNANDIANLTEVITNIRWSVVVERSLIERTAYK